MSQAAELQTAPTITLEEWAAMDEDDTGEVVDGRLVEEEVCDPVHELVIAWFVRVIGTWAKPRGAIVLTSGVKFGVAADRGRKPDLTLYLPGRRPPAHGLVRLPPDIAIEVVSPTPRDGRRDRVEKLGEYAAFGVRGYWLVDPQLRLTEVLELGADGRYVHAVSAATGTISVVPGCEGLALDLDDLWREVDALGVE